MKLCHLADIHFRGLARLDEYKRAFSKMIDDMRDNVKPDVIVICGDIVHSKTQGISPELIEHLTWFFTSLALIAEVHVILGNHDGNLMNPQRQDAISPIINAIANPRIKLYKKSGVYKFKPGFNFCVFSLFDEAGWANVKPVSGDVNIALFHGSVAGSVTDAGWALDSDLNVSFFNDYDFCFLGDIHSMQFLATRNNKPWIGYPGSTIMQDYGEKPGKGYLLWDIKSRDDFDVQFKYVEHDREFRTIEWTDLKDTLRRAKLLPRGSRIRIKSNIMVPHVETRQVMHELTMFHGASEVVFKDDYVSQTAVSAPADGDEKQDLRNADVLLKLFKDYLGDSTFDGKHWAAIRALIDKYLQRIVQDDACARNVRWQLRDLWFDNIFGYGSDNYINFRKLHGITGIFGPNRAGKSSIIGALIYTLFNGSDRGAIKNLHLINTRKGHCRAKVVFTLNGRDYRVERQSVRHETRAGLEHAVTNLNLFELDAGGNVINDMNGEQRKDTEKVLRTLVGTSDDIMLTGIAAQGDMNKFIDAGPAYRDLVMSRFLDLVVFEKMCQCAKDDSSSLKQEVNNSQERNWESLIASKEDEVQRRSSEILRLESVMKEKRTALDSLRIQLATSHAGDAITQADVDVVMQRLEDARADLVTAMSRREVYQRDSSVVASDIASVTERLAQIPLDKLRNELKAISKLKDAAADLRQALEKEKQVLANQDKSVKRLLDVPCGDQFPACKYIKDSHLDKSRLPEQRSVVEGLLEQVTSANAAIAGFDVGSIEESVTEHETLTKKLAALQLRSLQLKQSLTNAERTVKDCEETVTSIEMELTDYLSRVVEDDGSEQLKIGMSTLQRAIDELDAKRVKAASHVGSLGAEIKRLRQEMKRHEDAKAEWKMYELFIQATSKKGIPARIIHTRLPLINAEIARILQGVVDYTLRIEKDDESNNTEIFIDYGDSKRLVELGSGMEKMISSLAIRVALQNATSLPRPDFLVIDEGFGTLDETNIEACNRLLVSLKHWFKNIVVISHIDGVKDITDNVIEITRNGKDSYVNLE